MKTIYFLVGCILLSTNAILADPIIIDGTINTYKLSPYIHFLEDNTGKLTIVDVQSPKLLGEFQINKKEVPSFGITPSVYWFYFDYEASEILDTYLLEIEYPLLDNVTYSST